VKRFQPMFFIRLGPSKCDFPNTD